MLGSARVYRSPETYKPSHALNLNFMHHWKDIAEDVTTFRCWRPDLQTLKLRLEFWPFWKRYFGADFASRAEDS